MNGGNDGENDTGISGVFFQEQQRQHRARDLVSVRRRMAAIRIRLDSEDQMKKSK